MAHAECEFSMTWSIVADVREGRPERERERESEKERSGGESE